MLPRLEDDRLWDARNGHIVDRNILPLTVVLIPDGGE
jgi:hypothetical protein